MGAKVTPPLAPREKEIEEKEKEVS